MNFVTFSPYASQSVQSTINLPPSAEHLRLKNAVENKIFADNSTNSQSTIYCRRMEFYYTLVFPSSPYILRMTKPTPIFFFWRGPSYGANVSNETGACESVWNRLFDSYNSNVNVMIFLICISEPSLVHNLNRPPPDTIDLLRPPHLRLNRTNSIIFRVCIQLTVQSF